MTKWFDNVAADLKKSYVDAHVDLDVAKAALEERALVLDVIWRLAEKIEASGAPAKTKGSGYWGAGGEHSFADEELAAAIGADPRAIHAALAWLEARGHLIGFVDQCSAHGSTKIFDIPDSQVREKLSEK